MSANAQRSRHPSIRTGFLLSVVSMIIAGASGCGSSDGTVPGDVAKSMNDHSTFPVILPTAPGGWRYQLAAYPSQGKSSDVTFSLTAPSGNHVIVTEYAPNAHASLGTPNGQITVGGDTWTKFGALRWYRTLPNGIGVEIAPDRAGPADDLKTLAERFEGEGS